MILGKTRPMLRLLVLLLTVYAFSTLLSVSGKLAAAGRALEERKQAAEELRQSLAALRYDMEQAGEQENIERLAREKLGLVMPDETVIYYAGD